MTTLHDRARKFETEFVHDQELKFKIAVRRNRLLGLWAARLMGMDHAEAEFYSEFLVEKLLLADEAEVIAHIMHDLASAGQYLTAERIGFEMKLFADQAKRQMAT